MFKFNFKPNHRCLHANTLALFVQVQQTHMFTTLLPVELCALWRDTCYLLTVYRRVNNVPI